MAVTFKYENGEQLGPRFKARVQNYDKRQRASELAAARRAALEIERQGRANIRAGGDFGSARWQQGFRAKLSFGGGGELSIRVTHSVFYWRVFEEGRTIRGRPLLWIPLSFSEAGQLGVRARDFPGKLFRVNRPGKAPLLMSDSGPQYFGKASVRIPRKWRLRIIVKQVARQMRVFYREAMRNGR
jgi:hypothetical protein